MHKSARNCCVSHETHRRVSWYEQDSGISRWLYLHSKGQRFHKSPSTDTIPFFKSCECVALKRIKADVVNSGATLRYIEPCSAMLHWNPTRGRCLCDSCSQQPARKLFAACYRHHSRWFVISRILVTRCHRAVVLIS